ncbi:hypothetical protein FACS189492_2590 [Clostridia bacterium]|nr:hypothetical protein FACS189492_2590 [Clostridia bacterium]
MAVLQETELHKGKGKAWMITIVTVLVLGVPLQVFPYLWMVVNSFKENIDIIKDPLNFFAHTWNIGIYAETFGKYDLWRNFLNTAIVCGGTIVIQVTISALAAYSPFKISTSASALM